MYLAVHNHQDKARPLMQAMIEQGHKLVFARPDLFLSDHDGPEYYRRLIERMDAPVVIYPHGAGVFPAWDGVWEPNESVRAVLTWGDGQAEAMRAYGYPHPVHPVGWYLTERKPFRPTEGKRVLFGPVHPLNSGYLRQEWRRRNEIVYLHLLRMFNNNDIALTVRHVGHLTQSGLFPAYGVNYVKAGTVPLEEQIVEADVVIANGTLAMTALALGCPTVMFDASVRYMDAGREAKNWEAYKDEIEYPHQFGEPGWLDALTEDPVEYKRRFLGGEFDGKVLSGLLEAIVA